MRDLREVLVIVSLVHGVLRKGHGLVHHFERPIVHPYCDRSFRQTPLPVEFPVLKAQEPMLVQIPRVAKRIRSRNSAEYIVPLCHARTWTGLCVTKSKGLPPSEPKYCHKIILSRLNCCPHPSTRKSLWKGSFAEKPVWKIRLAENLCDINGISSSVTICYAKLMQIT